jgi:hypothetical protein
MRPFRKTKLRTLSFTGGSVLLALSLASANAAAQSCSWDATLTTFTLFFEPKLKNGLPVTGSMVVKRCGNPWAGAASWDNFATPGETFIGGMSGLQCVDMLPGATGHCLAPWVGGVAGSDVINGCVYAWGSFSYRLIPCQMQPACRD